MRGSKIVSSLTAVILGAMAWAPISQAIPINENTMDKDGALFTIEGEWTDLSTYRVTYWANFDEFDNEGSEDFLRAIDWKWQGGTISTISLVDAPGSLTDWSARPFYQIDYGNIVGCAFGGGFSAVCTEYVGDGPGLSTEISGDLAWIFDVNFRDVRQRDLLLGRGPRAGLLGDSALLASPLGITTASFTPDETNGQVPTPGVLSLLLIGLGALMGSRGRSPNRG
jgi:hypothetical protein